MNDSASGYVLTDPRPIAARAPYTFFLPGDAELAAVGPDDLVKLTFEYDVLVQEHDAERMWVRVASSDTEQLWGHLENQPSESNAPVKLGDPVAFLRHHILDIVWAAPDRAPPSVPYRQYWDRCFVDASVLDGSTPIEYLYREEPDAPEEGEKYPDSGWRIRGRGCFSDDQAEPVQVRYIAIGKVLNADDSWLHLIDSSIGSAFTRDWKSNAYLPVK